MLPADRYLAHLLGLTEDEYRYFQSEVRKRSLAAPQPSVVAGIDPFTWTVIALASTLISVGLTIAASFFKPSTDTNDPAQLQVKEKLRDSVSDNRRYAPRYGFDATQDVARSGSVIPLVYANRELISGTYYGGIRVNTALLWSQLKSYGGSQLLRAVFLIGEGPIGALDLNNFAIGGNTIGSYDFGNATANANGSRVAIYSRINGNLTTRLNSSHHVYGRAPGTDDGNSINDGAADIYQIDWNGTYKSAFSAASKPANQTSFGLYSMIGNNLDFRVNPVIRPKVQAQLIPEGDDGDAKVKCTIDDVASSQRKKARGRWGTRSGVTNSNVGVIGGNLGYVLHPSSDVQTTFSRAINIQSWSIEKTQVTEKSSGNLNKPSNKKWVYKHDNRKKAIDLTSRVSVSITASGVNLTENAITIGGKTVKPGWGYLTANITFDTAGLGESGEEPDETLELLKYTKFRITFTNQVVDNEDNKEERIRYVFKPRFKQRTTQEIDYDPGSVTTVNFIKVTDGSGNTTTSSVTTSGSSGSLNTIDTIDPPEWDATTISETVTLPFDVGNIHVERCTDIAASVAGRQKVWDDAIIEGDLYKAGSALVVCYSRTEEAFVSDADFSPVVVDQGTPVYANFTTVRPGICSLADPTDPEGAIADDSQGDGYSRYCATNWTHLYRCAIANITTTRACKVVEIGFRSSLGIRIQGLCNFRSAISFEEADERACLSRENDVIDSGNTLKVDSYQSGIMSSVEERYSFFRLYYRAAGSGADFVAATNCYGFRGATQQAQMNAIKLTMPSTQQWEFRFEPLSGWEIRSNAATGSLHILDGRLGNVTITDGALEVSFRGEANLPRTVDQFALVGTRTDESIGIPYVDSPSYVDAWGKLAEGFVYEEVTSSAQNPEHEIVYVNEIVSNTTEPLYDGLAILGLNIRSAAEWQQFSQFSCYVTGGLQCRRLLSSLSVGNTHLFPDILLDLLTNTTYGRGDVISDAMIDLTSFTEAATWCNSRKYFFDGAITSVTNIRQWAANTAAAHLLTFGESGGKFFLRKAVPTEPVPIAGLFTAGNIQEGSFRLQFLDPEDREPIRVSVRYREERASTDLANPGLFPLEREVLVQEASGAAEDRIESLDLSDFCTNQQHAKDAAKYVIRQRRLSDHAISFTITYDAVLSGLAPSDYIRVAMDTTHYDEFSNGCVTASGALISTKPLADGTYDVILWNGQASDPPEDGVLAVASGGTVAAPAGIIFTVKSLTTQVRTYQIESIRPSEDGLFQIEAVHAPTNSSGVLLLAEGFDNESNWIYEV